MTTRTIRRLLLYAGSASLIAYVISALANNALRLDKAKALGVSDEVLNITSNTFILGVVLESPLHLTPAVLCFMAAKYLSNWHEKIPEVFK